jgi:hypothetical protein
MPQEGLQPLPKGMNALCCIGDICQSYRAFSFPEAVTIVSIYNYYVKYRVSSTECLFRERNYSDIIYAQLEMLKAKDEQFHIMEQDRDDYRDSYLRLSQQCGPSTSEAWTWIGWIVAGSLILAGGAYYGIEHLNR